MKILGVTQERLWRTDVAGNNKTYLGTYVKARYFCPILTKFWVSRQIFVKLQYQIAWKSLQ
jgi:hypothetical protein